MVSCETTNTTWNGTDYITGVISSLPQFLVSGTWSFTPDTRNRSNKTLTLLAGWADNNVNVFIQQKCNLSLVMVSYPSQIVNDTITLNLEVRTDPEVLADLPVAHMPLLFGEDIGSLTTLGGFYLLSTQFQSNTGPFFANVSMFRNGAEALFSLLGNSPFAWAHAVNPNWDPIHNSYVWRNPMPDVLAAFHEIMFRLVLQVATNTTLVALIVLDGITYSSLSNVSAIWTFSENYYVSKYDFLVGAVAVVVLAVLSISLT